MENKIYQLHDVVIIGGGPAGSSCAMYTARAKLKTVVLDKAPGSGALGLTAKIANYPGVSGEIAGIDLLNIIRDQAAEFGAEYIRAGVVSVDLQADPKEVYSTEGLFLGKTVVIATGSMGRAERVPGEEEFVGRGVSYCVICDAPFLEGRTGVVIGDTDVALDEALYLARFAAKVYLIAPRQQFRADERLVRSVSEESRIESVMGWRLREIISAETVKAIRVQSAEGEEREIPADGVFVLLAGQQPITDFLQGTLPVTEEGCIVVNQEKETAVPGVYAIGDVTCSHVKQAVVSAAEGVVAALAIDKHLNKREKLRVDYK